MSGRIDACTLRLRIDTRRERDWCGAGGILPYVGREMIRADAVAV